MEHVGLRFLDQQKHANPLESDEFTSEILLRATNIGHNERYVPSLQLADIKLYI
jgi:hypothetical protein